MPNKWTLTRAGFSIENRVLIENIKTRNLIAKAKIDLRYFHLSNPNIYRAKIAIKRLLVLPSTKSGASTVNKNNGVLLA